MNPTFHRLLGAIALLVMLSSCRVDPRYTAPAYPGDGAAFVTHSEHTRPDAPLPDAWWRLYEEPQIDALVREALRANTDVRVAVANLRVARGVAAEFGAGRYPTTTLNGGAVYGRDSVADGLSAAFHSPPPDLWTTLGQASISYELDFFGRVSRGIEAAEADVGGAAAAADVVRVSVAAETTRAYVTACTAGLQLDVARPSAEIAADAVRLTRALYSAGAGTNIDLERSQVLADQTKASLPVFDGQRRSAAYELAALLGRTPGDAPASVVSCQEPPRLIAAIPLGDTISLLRRRPDVRLQERRLAAATARIGVSTASLYPRIALGADVNYASNSALPGATAFSLALGPLASVSFPNNIVAQARLGESRAFASAALASFDGTVLRALKEADQALTLYSVDQRRRDSLASALVAADRAYQLTQGRRRAGAIGALEVDVAESSLLSARAALAAVDARIADDEITLFKALGGGWQRL